MRFWIKHGGYGLGVLGLLAAAGCGGGHEKHLESGLEELARTNYVEAVRHFNQVAQHQPPNSTAFYNLGLGYWKLGNTDQAIQALTMAGDLEPNDPRPLLLLAEVLQDAKQWDEARKVLTTINNGLPERPDLLTRLARLEYRAGNAAEAATHLDSALQLDPSYPPALYNMAVLARDQQGDALTAMRFFSRFLAVSTDQARIDRVHEELARLRQPFRPALPPERPPRGANATLSTLPPRDTSPTPPAPVPTQAPALATVSDAEVALNLLAQARAALGEEAFDEALVFLSQARARDPRNADVLWTTAGLYDQQLKQPAKAEGILRDFVRLFPQDTRTVAAQRRLGQVAGTGTRGAVPPPTTTITAARDATPAPPAPTTTTRPPPSTRQSLQDIWRQALDAHSAGRWSDAIRLYESALTLDPNFASAAFNLGVAYKSQGNQEFARAAFSRAVTIDPRMAKAHYMLAVLYREQGDRNRAIDSAKRTLAINPNDDKTHYLLGLLYRDSLRYDLARYHFKRAVELAPDRAAADKARTALASMPAPGAKR